MLDLLHTLPGLSLFLGPNPDWKQLLLALMTPVFFLAFFIEFAAQRRANPGHTVHWKEVFANIGLGTTYQAIEGLMWLLVTGAVFNAVYAHRLFTIEATALTVLPIYLLVELCYYAFHRASHRIRWFWAAHVVHHTGEHMNFSTAARQSILNGVLGSAAFYLPAVWLGVSPGVVMLMLAINLVYQYFIHTEWVQRLPAWVEWVFNTPSHHRVHHGRNARYIDKNFGGTLIVFDRLLGSFEPETEAVDYGIPRQIQSHNLFVLNLHEFIDMLRDVAAPGPWWQRLQHLWRPPEWEREGHTPIHTFSVKRHDR